MPRAEVAQAYFWALLLWGPRAFSVRHQWGSLQHLLLLQRQAQKAPRPRGEMGAREGERDEEMEDML